MIDSYLMIGMSFNKVFKLILKHGLQFNSKTLKRQVLLLNIGLLTSLFPVIEKIKINHRIKKFKLEKDPVIIIGHFRSGTTYLHQLLSCDPNYSTPGLLECCCPDYFITGNKKIGQLMGKNIPSKRPMDNVKVNLNSPTEDELAIFRLTGHSPFESLIYPKSHAYFLKHYESAFHGKNCLLKREQSLKWFVKKLNYYHQKQVLLKNPFHSYRIPQLLEVFPNAQFIHIIRDPRYVIPSSIRTWNIVGQNNCLKNPFPAPDFEDVVVGYQQMLKKINIDKMNISKNQYCEIFFEDLEKNPKSALKEIYQKLNLNHQWEQNKQLNDFLEQIKDYHKNSYSISQYENRIIHKHLEDLDILKRYFK